MVADRVLDLVVGPVGGANALPHLEQSRVEEPLLGVGVHLDQHLEAGPDRGEHVDVVAADVVEHREAATLPVVLGQDQVS